MVSALKAFKTGFIDWAFVKMNIEQKKGGFVGIGCKVP